MGSRMDARLSIAVVAAVFFAASAFPGISAGLEGYSPGHLALLRFLVASFVLAIYTVFSGIRLPAAKDLPAVALAGFLAFSVYNVLLGYGQTSVPAETASLLIASIPAFTALLAVAFLRERLGARGWAGIMVSFLGVALISFGKGEGGRWSSGDSRRGLGQHAGREERERAVNRVSGTARTRSALFLLEIGDEMCGDLPGLLRSVFGHPQRVGDVGSLVEDHKPLCQILRILGATLGGKLSQVSTHPHLLLHHHHPRGMVSVR
jgi:uncharacterized membrane protein